MTDRVRITRAVEFSSSLRLARPDLSEAENQRLYGPASRRHGHNFRLEVSLVGSPDPTTGMLVDLKDVKELLERQVVDRFDHRDLNDDTDCFEKAPPTPENFARVLFGLLDGRAEGATLDRVRLYSGPDQWVDVTRDPGDA